MYVVTYMYTYVHTYIRKNIRASAYVLAKLRYSAAVNTILQSRAIFSLSLSLSLRLFNSTSLSLSFLFIWSRHHPLLPPLVNIVRPQKERESYPYEANYLRSIEHHPSSLLPFFFLYLLLLLLFILSLLFFFFVLISLISLFSFFVLGFFSLFFFPLSFSSHICISTRYIPLVRFPPLYLFFFSFSFPTIRLSLFLVQEHHLPLDSSVRSI